MTERERESQRARWTEKECFGCSEGHREAQIGVVCIPWGLSSPGAGARSRGCRGGWRCLCTPPSWAAPARWPPPQCPTSELHKYRARSPLQCPTPVHSQDTSKQGQAERRNKSKTTTKGKGDQKSNRKEKTQREVAAAAGKERVKQVRFGHWHTQRRFWHAGYHSGTSTIIPLRADTETGETAGGRGNGRLKPVRPNAPKVLRWQDEKHCCCWCRVQSPKQTCTSRPGRNYV